MCLGQILGRLMGRGWKGGQHRRENMAERPGCRTAAGVSAQAKGPEKTGELSEAVIKF